MTKHVWGRGALATACVLAFLTPAYADGDNTIDIGPQFCSPSREVVTPHIAWANPYASGKLRVLFIGHRYRMREVIEFAQRLEMDYDFAATCFESADRMLKPFNVRRGYYNRYRGNDKAREACPTPVRHRSGRTRAPSLCEEHELRGRPRGRVTAACAR